MAYLVSRRLYLRARRPPSGMEAWEMGGTYLTISAEIKGWRVNVPVTFVSIFDGRCVAASVLSD